MVLPRSSPSKMIWASSLWAEEKYELDASSWASHNQSSPLPFFATTAVGLGCVKTFWRGRTPASTNSLISGQANLPCSCNCEPPGASAAVAKKLPPPRGIVSALLRYARSLSAWVLCHFPTQNLDAASL